MIPEELGPIGDFFNGNFMMQLRAMGVALPDVPNTMDWARADMAVDETLRQLLVIGATQPRLARFVAGLEAGDSRRGRVQREIRHWREIAEAQLADGQVIPVWRRFVTSSDVSVSLLYPDPGTQIIDSTDAFAACLAWARDGGRSALAWGLTYPEEARAAFNVPRRLKARIERISTRAADFDIEAAEAQRQVDYIVEEYGGLPNGNA